MRRSWVRIPSRPPKKTGPARRHGLHNVPDTWVTPFGVDFERCQPPLKLPSRTKVWRAALPLCPGVRLRCCIIAQAPAFLSASRRSSFRWFAGLHGFFLVLEVMPPQKIRSTSSVLRNFLAMTQGHPFLVSFALWGRMGSRAVLTLSSPNRSIPNHNP